MLAAACGFGLAKNHLFVDGNKRAAFAAVIVFMAKNQSPSDPTPADATHTIIELAAGKLRVSGHASRLEESRDAQRAVLASRRSRGAGEKADSFRARNDGSRACGGIVTAVADGSIRIAAGIRTR